jgi:hypothetical protein
MQALFKKTWFNPAGVRMRPGIWHDVNPKWELPKGTITKDEAPEAAPVDEPELSLDEKPAKDDKQVKNEKPAPEKKSALEKL